jgi:hypothetical protein
MLDRPAAIVEVRRVTAFVYTYVRFRITSHTRKCAQQVECVLIIVAHLTLQPGNSMLLAGNLAAVTSRMQNAAIYFQRSGCCFKMAAATAQSSVSHKIVGMFLVCVYIYILILKIILVPRCAVKNL